MSNDKKESKRDSWDLPPWDEIKPLSWDLPKWTKLPSWEELFKGSSPHSTETASRTNTPPFYG